MCENWVKKILKVFFILSYTFTTCQVNITPFTTDVCILFSFKFLRFRTNYPIHNPVITVTKINYC